MGGGNVCLGVLSLLEWPPGTVNYHPSFWWGFVKFRVRVFFST